MAETEPGTNIEWLCVKGSTPIMEVLNRQAGAVDRGLPAGIAIVVGDDGAVQGTVTDGDVRRAILKKRSLAITAADAMRADPILFQDGTSFRGIMQSLPEELERRGRRGPRFLGKIILVDEARRPVRVLDYYQLWEQRVATHRHVVVIGMGYVGLTLALELAEEGFRVTGVDIDKEKIEVLSRGESHVHEQGIYELVREQLNRNFFVSGAVPEDGDVFIIAVGTPVAPESGLDMPVPHLDALKSAVKMVGVKLLYGGLVILRSTVPVGTTRELVVPMLEEASGLKAGQEFHLAFAPERTLEGRALEELRSLPQIIGGLNEDSVEATAALFRELTPVIVRMESLEAAELAKLINNAFRDVIFAFANEVVQMASPFNLDSVEVIRAANRGYPRDRVPLPSPGVGGPCLTKDPFILGSLAARAGLDASLSTLGRRINISMHDMVALAVLGQLSGLGKDPRQCTVLVCGLAFKGRPETGDLRNSSAIEIAKLIKPHVRRLLGHDPVAGREDIATEGLQPVGLPEGFKDVDAVLLLNNHPYYEKLDVFSMARALRAPGVVYDGWHLLRPDDVLGACPSVYMGLGFIRSSVESAAGEGS